VSKKESNRTLEAQVSKEALNLAELEAEAKAVLSKMAYDYYASGSDDEVTLGENCLAYQRMKILPRMLVDVSRRDTSTTILGAPISMPIVVAPTAFHGLADDRAEVATVKGAGRAGTIFTLSTLSNSTIEEVLSAASAPVWFQLYVFKDRAITASLVKRAEAAGAKAIVLTVDAPMLGRRERDVRNRFQLPPNLSAKNLFAAGLQDLPAGVADSGLAAYIATLFDEAVTWKDVDWLRSITKLPILVKGILRVDDAKCAVQCGVDGIVVSNHGGRQLDTVPATISVLPAIVDAVGEHCEILVDGGIRRGTDIFKALACGARAVLLGRPILWGLAVNGELGVTAVLEAMRKELDLAMALSGCPDLNSITRDMVHLP
jgi:4-hydroxymandelate oxidase